ncbi:MAG: NaeI family type II restriction endonuclease [Archangium sp.]|nr:NaeI family type II restriction endonuclease [Archangium sp.]MDP3574301.1 NaeI family type II restriction endonuclease [Archangium sp.]
MLKALQSERAFENRVARVLRETFDQLYDGVRTGRFRWEQLNKTEKTHAGTVLQLNLRREFDGFIGDGVEQDFLIDNVDVDCKFSKDFGKWMIPPEAVGHVCLLIWGSEQDSAHRTVWSCGLIQIEESGLRPSKNRDAKRNLTLEAISSIKWLARDAAYPENLLASLDAVTAEKIFPSGDSPYARGKGSERVRSLFRNVQRRLIPRTAIETAARQKDPLKRVRGNGGARSVLAQEGIIILGHWDEHCRIAWALRLPEPTQSGEFVSAQVERTSDHQQSVEIDGGRWRLARPGAAVSPAPDVPMKNDDD